jgi:L-asparagine transporter-like permease
VYGYLKIVWYSSIIWKALSYAVPCSFKAFVPTQLYYCGHALAISTIRVVDSFNVTCTRVTLLVSTMWVLLCRFKWKREKQMTSMNYHKAVDFFITNTVCARCFLMLVLRIIWREEKNTCIICWLVLWSCERGCKDRIIRYTRLRINQNQYCREVLKSAGFRKINSFRITEQSRELCLTLYWTT